MRRLLMFCCVSAAVALASTWWLYEGDLALAVEPVVPEWNADDLAIRAGIVDLPSARPALEPAPDATAAEGG